MNIFVSLHKETRPKGQNTIAPRTCSSMDRITDSGSVDLGSIPNRCTTHNTY